MPLEIVDLIFKIEVEKNPGSRRKIVELCHWAREHYRTPLKLRLLNGSRDAEASSSPGHIDVPLEDWDTFFKAVIAFDKVFEGQGFTFAQIQCVEVCLPGEGVEEDEGERGEEEEGGEEEGEEEEGKNDWATEELWYALSTFSIKHLKISAYYDSVHFKSYMGFVGEAGKTFSGVEVLTLNLQYIGSDEEVSFS